VLLLRKGRAKHRCRGSDEHYTPGRGPKTEAREARVRTKSIASGGQGTCRLSPRAAGGPTSPGPGSSRRRIRGRRQRAGRGPAG